MSDVVDTMVSNTGGFAAIFHRHRGADRFRKIVLVLACRTDSAHPHFAVATAGRTRCNSPRHSANACHELFLTTGQTKIARLSERAEISLGV